MMKFASAAVLLSLVGLCGCGGGAGNTATADQQQYNDYRTQGADTQPGGGLTITTGQPSGGGNNTSDTSTSLGVNAYLWRGTLDTLSFMPLVSADPFGGVIITDWYTPPGVSGERFKATIYILGRELRSDGLRVSIFRQVNTGSGWQDSQVTASTDSEIEDKILARARELRAAANAAG